MQPDDSELVATLRSLELENYAEVMAPYAHLEIALEPIAAAQTSLCASRLGGALSAPTDFQWPTQRWSLSEIQRWPDFAQQEVSTALAQGTVYQEHEQLVMPLLFLCQLRLEEIAPLIPEYNLPSHGMLAFFASTTTETPDPLFTKRVASAVRWINAPEATLRAVSQPPTPDPLLDGVLLLRPSRWVSFEPDYEQLVALREQIPQRSFAAFTERNHLLRHELFASPRQEAGGPMPPPGELALLRLHEQPELGFYVGDASWLTYSLPCRALEERRFEAARASVFCG